ncbi:MAG: hypothetical protein CM15mP58_23280 [Burkholderiaceae bacterium]|nr:MAG: hypothetical protein CM15mP58_23280 [Burkholderiaceae bacterium]
MHLVQVSLPQVELAKTGDWSSWKFKGNIFLLKITRFGALKKIFLASSNPGKIKEFSNFFLGLEFDVIGQAE